MKTSLGNTSKVVRNNKNFLGVNIVLGIIFLAGIFAWSRGLVGYPGVTNLNDYAPWGIYISFFLFFEALAAGTLFVVALGGIVKGLEIPRKFMLLVGIVSAVCAGLAILPDLGSPLGLWRLIFTPNFAAPMILDVWFLGLTVLAGVLLWWGISTKGESLDKGASYALAIITVLLPLGTAWLFTTFPGKMGWMSSLEGPMFLVQAALAGVCVLLLVGNFSNRNQSKAGSNALAAILAINLLLVVGEMGYTLYNTGIETLPMRGLMFGQYAGVFWVQLIFFLLLPFFLLFSKKATIPAVLLSLAGVILSKYLFIVKGNQFPFLHETEGLDISSLASGLNGYQATPFYFPTWEEWLVVIGIIAIGILLFRLGYNRLKNS